MGLSDSNEISVHATETCICGTAEQYYRDPQEPIAMHRAESSSQIDPFLCL